MDLARYVVDAVVVEGRTYREVARAHGVSKSWVGKLLGWFREGGYKAIVPRSRAAKAIPHRTTAAVEDEIVKLRKELQNEGLDAGAETIRSHLVRRRPDVPSVSTIWRVLRRRGFVIPQPHKRPRSSWIRFEARLPNERWQSDVTTWKLHGGKEVEIVNFLDDHSRVVTASRVVQVATATGVVRVFRGAVRRLGLPAAVLTDNWGVYTAWHRGGATAMEVELLGLGIEFRHSRPYHPQTCGKVERFHQTLKRYLARQEPAETLEQLQAQIDRFVTYYNDVRPHRAKDRRTPRSAFESRDKAKPHPLGHSHPKELRVRHDRIDRDGTVTIRYRSKLHHIGMGRALTGRRVILLVADRHIRVIDTEGQLLRELELDPSRNYQGRGL